MSADSFKPIPKELDDAGQWKDRSDREYILEKHYKGALGDMFKYDCNKHLAIEIHSP